MNTKKILIGLLSVAVVAALGTALWFNQGTLFKGAIVSAPVDTVTAVNFSETDIRNNPNNPIYAYADESSILDGLSSLLKNDDTSPTGGVNSAPTLESNGGTLNINNQAYNVAVPIEYYNQSAISIVNNKLQIDRAKLPYNKYTVVLKITPQIIAAVPGFQSAHAQTASQPISGSIDSNGYAFFTIPDQLTAPELFVTLADPSGDLSFNVTFTNNDLLCSFNSLKLDPAQPYSITSPSGVIRSYEKKTDYSSTTFVSSAYDPVSINNLVIPDKCLVQYGLYFMLTKEAETESILNGYAANFSENFARFVANGMEFNYKLQDGTYLPAGKYKLTISDPDVSTTDIKLDLLVIDPLEVSANVPYGQTTSLNPTPNSESDILNVTFRIFDPANAGTNERLELFVDTSDTARVSILDYFLNNSANYFPSSLVESYMASTSNPDNPVVYEMHPVQDINGNTLYQEGSFKHTVAAIPTSGYPFNLSGYDYAQAISVEYQIPQNSLTFKESLPLNFTPTCAVNSGFAFEPDTLTFDLTAPEQREYFNIRGTDSSGQIISGSTLTGTSDSLRVCNSNINQLILTDSSGNILSSGTFEGYLQTYPQFFINPGEGSSFSINPWYPAYANPDTLQDEILSAGTYYIKLLGADNNEYDTLTLVLGNGVVAPSEFSYQTNAADIVESLTNPSFIDLIEAFSKNILPQQANQTLLKYQFTNSNAKVLNVNSLTFKPWIDYDPSDPSGFKNPTDTGENNNEISIFSYFDPYQLELFIDGVKVASPTGTTNSLITFENLNLNIPFGSAKDIELRGNLKISDIYIATLKKDLAFRFTLDSYDVKAGTELVAIVNEVNNEKDGKQSLLLTRNCVDADGFNFSPALISYTQGSTPATKNSTLSLRFDLFSDHNKAVYSKYINTDDQYSGPAISEMDLICSNALFMDIANIKARLRNADKSILTESSVTVISGKSTTLNGFTSSEQLNWVTDFSQKPDGQNFLAPGQYLFELANGTKSLGGYQLEVLTVGQPPSPQPVVQPQPAPTTNVINNYYSTVTSPTITNPCVVGDKTYSYADASSRYCADLKALADTKVFQADLPADSPQVRYTTAIAVKRMIGNDQFRYRNLASDWCEKFTDSDEICESSAQEISDIKSVYSPNVLRGRIDPQNTVLVELAPFDQIRVAEIFALFEQAYSSVFGKQQIIEANLPSFILDIYKNSDGTINQDNEWLARGYSFAVDHNIIEKSDFTSLNQILQFINRETFVHYMSEFDQQF